MNRFTSLYSVLVLIFILALSSCSVEKRTFNRGYHVSWNKHLRHISPAEGIAENELAENEIKQTPGSDEELNLEPVNAESLEQSCVFDQELSVESLASFEPSSEDFILAENPPSAPDTVYYYPKFEPFGIASFASAGGAILSCLVFFPVSILLAIAGIVFGAISFARYRRSPELYRKNGFAVAGFVLSILTLLVIVVGVVLIVLFLML